MDYFVFVGVWLFFAILFWAAVKLNKAKESERWNKYDESHSDQHDHAPKPIRF